MKTSFYAAAGLVAAAGTAHGQAVTAQDKITMFSPEDFTFSLGGPEPSTTTASGAQVRAVNVNQLPALEGQGIAMALVNLEACSINLPHVHPRATEMLYVIEGDVTSAFVEENGGEGAVVNDLVQGDVMFFPQGLIHYQQNLGCEPVTFLAALNNDDPGVVTITTRFFELPTEAIQGSLNFEDAALQAMIEGLPMAPAEARTECLIMCGLLDEGMVEEPVEEPVDEMVAEPGVDTLFCNSIGCTDGLMPIMNAGSVPCDGNVCEVGQCCEAFCNSIGCPNSFGPIADAGSVRCTDGNCTTEQCCVEFDGGRRLRR